jgi:hypothetical protein
VKVSRRIGTLLPYTDICGGDYLSPYSDSDISGNTTYYYYVTPYMTKYGSITTGSVSSIVSSTTPPAYPTDVSAIFYDTSAIQLKFTSPKNSYSSIAPSYVASLINGTTTVTKTGSSPILIQNLSSGTSYTCYILTYFDGSLRSTSRGINVTTNSTIVNVLLSYKSYSNTVVTYYALTDNALEQISSNNGSVSGTVTFNSSYAYFNGGYINVPYASINNLTQGTISVWINVLSATGGPFTIFAKQSNGSYSNSIFTVGPWNGSYNGKIYFNPTSASTNIYSTSTITLNQWLHVAITFTSTTLKIYMNGSLDSTWTGSSYSIPDKTSGTGCCIGYFPGDGGGHVYLGYMKYFAVWSTELSAANISSIYNLSK